MFQVHIFTDKRTGAANVPAPSSGFSIPFQSTQDQYANVDLTVSKAGQAVTANNFTATAGVTSPAVRISSGAIRIVPLLVVNPGLTTLTAGQALQLSAVYGTTPAVVTWSLSPNVGTISANGQYIAPATITSQQNIYVTATVTGGTPDQIATAVVTLNP